MRWEKNGPKQYLFANPGLKIGRAGLSEPCVRENCTVTNNMSNYVLN